MRPVLFAIVLLVFIGFPSSELHANEARTLGDYRFIPTPQVRDPFITTHFRNLTGVAVAIGLDLPPVILPTVPPDTLLTVNGDFIFVVMELEYQYAFGDRATLRASFVGASRVGTSGSSILSQGVTATWGGQIGTTVALWRSDRALLSAIGDIWRAKVLVIDLVGYVQDIVDGNEAAPSLVKTEDRTSFLPGLSGAWAINRWSGLAANAQIGVANGTKTDSNTIWKVGASGSIDFEQRGQAPVGLLASFEANETPALVERESTVSTTVGLGIFYTGRDDLNLGGEINWSDIPLDYQDVSANPVTFSAVFSYFF